MQKGAVPEQLPGNGVDVPGVYRRVGFRQNVNDRLEHRLSRAPARVDHPRGQRTGEEASTYGIEPIRSSGSAAPALGRAPRRVHPTGRAAQLSMGSRSPATMGPCTAL